MQTLEQATEWMRRNKTPYWWVKAGNNRVANNTEIADLEESLTDFQAQLSFLPAGKYSLEASRKVNDRRSSNSTTFEKGETQEMASQQYSNPWDRNSQQAKDFEAQIRRDVMMENIVAKMDKFLDEWPEYKKKIDTLWQEDRDGDGIPDILDTAKKVGDAVNGIAKVKTVWEGASRL